jgi:hypothetical protein
MDARGIRLPGPTRTFRQGLGEPPPGPVLARFASRVSREGYWDEDGELWSGDRQLLAQSVSYAFSGHSLKAERRRMARLSCGTRCRWDGAVSTAIH